MIYKATTITNPKIKFREDILNGSCQLELFDFEFVQS